MTDARLYLAIGIPSALFMLNFLAVLAGFFWQAKRFDDLKDMLRSDIGRVESEFRSGLARVEGELRSDLARVEGGLRSELARVEGELRSDLARVEGGLRSDLARVEGVLGTKIDSLTLRVAALEEKNGSLISER